MALRLRRGTDAERLLITPLEGELIYTIDTKKLYVGDGITIGGIAVDTTGLIDLSTKSISELNDVNIGNDSTIPQPNDVLKYDFSSGDWRPGTLSLNDLFDVVTDSSTPANGDVLAFSLSSGEWNPASLSLNSLNDINLTITPNNGDILRYNAIAGEWGNVPLSSVSTSITDLADVDNPIPVNNDVLVYNGTTSQYEGVQFNLQNLFDVDVTSGIVNNEILVYNSISGFFEPKSQLTNNIRSVDNTLTMVNTITKHMRANEFTGNFRGSFFADDSSIIIDGITGLINANVLQGTFNGNIIGDLTGSVFADDSTLLVDAVNGKLVGDHIGNVTTDVITSNNNTIVMEVGNYVEVESSLSVPILYVKNNKPTSDLQLGSTLHGLVIIRTTDTNGTNNSAIFGSAASGLTIGKLDASFSFPDSHKFFIGTNGNFGFGTITPTTKFDFVGNANFSGVVNAASFKGSLFADDSSILVDSVNGTIPGYVSIADLKTALQDGAGDYAAFKAWILANL